MTPLGRGPAVSYTLTALSFVEPIKAPVISGCGALMVRSGPSTARCTLQHHSSKPGESHQASTRVMSSI
jgi:hypothetical protein